MFSKKLPDCDACGYVKIIPENYEVMMLIEKYLPMMYDSMGGINIIAIDLILSMNLVSKQEKPELLEKIITYLYASMKQKQDERSIN